MFLILREQDTRKEASLHSVPYPEGTRHKEGSISYIVFLILREQDTRKEALLHSVPYLEGRGHKKRSQLWVSPVWKRTQEEVPTLSVTCLEEETRRGPNSECHLSIKICPSGYQDIEGHLSGRRRHKKLFQLWVSSVHQAIRTSRDICLEEEDTRSCSSFECHLSIRPSGHWGTFVWKKTQEEVLALSVVCPSLPSQDHQDTRTQGVSKLRGTRSLSNVL